MCHQQSSETCTCGEVKNWSGVSDVPQCPQLVWKKFFGLEQDMHLDSPICEENFQMMKTYLGCQQCKICDRGDWDKNWKMLGERAEVVSLLFTQFEGFPQLSSRDCVCGNCAALCLSDHQIDIAGDLLSNFDESKISPSQLSIPLKSMVIYFTKISYPHLKMP